MESPKGDSKMTFGNIMVTLTSLKSDSKELSGKFISFWEENPIVLLSFG